MIFTFLCDSDIVAISVLQLELGLLDVELELLLSPYVLADIIFKFLKTHFVL